MLSRTDLLNSTLSLQNDTDLAAQPSRIDLRDIDAVNQHASAFGHIKTLNELGESAFAGARSPDDSDHLAGRNVEIDVMQNLRTVDAIAKADVIECHVATNRRQCHTAGVVHRFGRRIEDVAGVG